MTSIESRLLAKLDRSGEHWIFTGVLDHGGYGLLWDSRRRNNSKAHRVAYEVWVGPIPAGKQIHHGCRVRACCRPDHLELLDAAVHNSSHHVKTHCINGHEFTPGNTRHVRGQKVCKMCEKAARDRYLAGHREAINERKRQRRRSQ
jgi:hypothetical protein